MVLYSIVSFDACFDDRIINSDRSGLRSICFNLIDVAAFSDLH